MGVQSFVKFHEKKNRKTYPWQRNYSSTYDPSKQFFLYIEFFVFFQSRINFQLFFARNFTLEYIGHLCLISQNSKEKLVSLVCFLNLILIQGVEHPECSKSSSDGDIPNCLCYTAYSRIGLWINKKKTACYFEVIVSIAYLEGPH